MMMDHLSACRPLTLLCVVLLLLLHLTLCPVLCHADKTTAVAATTTTATCETRTIDVLPPPNFSKVSKLIFLKL